MGQLPELRGQFTIGTSTSGFNVGTTAVSLDQNTYYTIAASDETNGLIDAVQSAIRDAGGQGNCNVTYSTTSGLVTIALNTAQPLTFNAALAPILGFATAAQANAATHTATQIPQHIWRPTRGMSGHPVDANVFWSPRSSTVVGRSIDGTTYAREGTITYDAEISFSPLPAADVVTPSNGTVGRDLQAFYTDVACKGMPIRVYPDRTATANSDYWREGFWGADDLEELGTFEDYKDRYVAQWQSLWRVSIPLIKKV